MGNATAEQTTRLYTLFVDAGVQHFESGSRMPSTNERLLGQLRETCNGVEFIVRDLSRGPMTLDGVARELGDTVQSFDGVVVFGGLNDYRPILTDLPTVAVHNFPEFSHLLYALFEERERVVMAACDRANICQPTISASVFQDLVRKIGLLDALGKMKRPVSSPSPTTPTSMRITATGTTPIPAIYGRNLRKSSTRSSRRQLGISRAPE